MTEFALSHAPPRFRSKVRIAPSGCWEWMAAKTKGYGAYCIDGRRAASRKQMSSHRFAYEWFVGEVPVGLEIDHLCRNRACCNPAHLEPVTSAENKRRSPLVGRAPSVNKPGGNNGNGLLTHCKNGHEFTSENTYQRGSGKGRTCRTCNRASAARTQRVRLERSARLLDRMIEVGREEVAA